MVLFLDTNGASEAVLNTWCSMLGDGLGLYGGMFLKSDLSAAGTNWICLFGLPLVCGHTGERNVDVNDEHSVGSCNLWEAKTMKESTNAHGSCPRSSGCPRPTDHRGVTSLVSSMTVLSMLLLAAVDLPDAVIPADPSNYRSLLATLVPGDTLALASGTYPDGLPLVNMNGQPGLAIAITGPTSGVPAVFTGRSLSIASTGGTPDR